MKLFSKNPTVQPQANPKNSSNSTLDVIGNNDWRKHSIAPGGSLTHQEPYSRYGLFFSRGIKLALQGGVLIIVLLFGMLLQRSGASVAPVLPPSYSLPLITPTLSSSTVTVVPTPAPVPDVTLPTLYLTIPPVYFEQIAAVREKALKLGILLAEDNVSVPATLRYDNVDMPAKVSLKGDWADHLRGDKWSFRIKMDNNYRVFGMAVFAIQNPPVRNYANEWGYMANLRRDGVLAPRYQFVNVVLNDQPKGIYALEEGFSKELFEAQERREGLIMRYSEDMMWTYRSLYANHYVPRGVDAFYIVEEYMAGRIADAPGLSAQREAAFGMLRGVWGGEMLASDAFDARLTGRFLALTNLWGGQHGLVWHNLRYFYNPVSTRIEPIGFNANALEKAGIKFDLPPEVFYRDPLLQAAYIKAALEVTSPEYLEKLEADLGPELAELNKTLSGEFGELALPWDALRQRAAEIRQRIEPYQTVYAYLPLDEPNVVEVGNFVDWPVQVMSLEAGGQSIALQRDWVTSDSQALLVPGTEALALLPLASDAVDVAYARILIPQEVVSLTATTQVTLVTRLLGGTDQQYQPVWQRYPSPVAHGPRPTATLEEALARHPFLERDPATDWLLVKPGEWNVAGDLILPQGYGLHIGPGTTLRFEPGAILVVSGGPVLFEGEPDAPILLTTIEGADTWGGIAVMEASAPSVLRYVTIEKTGGLHRAGWGTTAGTTFYKSQVRLSNCRLLHNQTEDAINFIHSPFEVLDSEFAYTFADALDSDFSSGLVERSTFHDTGNDGLDVSGTPVTIRQVTMYDMGDKGVSVGENSTADIDGLTVTRAYMGVAVKDGSHATLRNATLSQVLVAGLAAYTKKTEYGPATMTATDVQFDDVARQILVQTGHWIDLEGTRIWGVEVDVNKLYLPFTKER